MQSARFLLLLLVLLAWVPVAAAEGVSVSGRVLDSQGGLPVPNATVQLDRNGRQIAVARTDATGAFRMSGVPLGTYSIFISAPGYQSWGQQFVQL